MFLLCNQLNSSILALSGSSGNHAVPGRVGSSDSSGDGAGGPTKKSGKGSTDPKPKKEPKQKKKAKKVIPPPEDEHEPIDDRDDDDSDEQDDDGVETHEHDAGSKKNPMKRPAAAKSSTKKPASRSRKHCEEDCGLWGGKGENNIILSSTTCGLRVPIKIGFMVIHNLELRVGALCILIIMFFPLNSVNDIIW